MADGYTRQSTAAIAADEVIRAAPLNAEFNELEDAFDATGGHAHDGTLGNGPKIILTAANGVSGVLPIANGGTGATTAADARTNLNVQVADAELTAISALAGTGFITHTGPGTASERTLTGTAGEIDISNPAGISGNPTFSFPSTIVLTGKSVTGGTFTSITVTGGTITGITDLTIADGGTGASTAAGARTNLGVSTVGNTGSGADLSSPIVDATHGNLSGGTLHAEATTSDAGFMSAADKLKLDGISGTNPSGTVIMYGGNTPPIGYLPCDGAAISRTTYADLFTAINTLHGVGDGSTTFNVPDFRGRFARGWNDTGSGIDASRVFGSVQTDSFESHTHVFTGDAVAAHTHTASTAAGGAHNHTATTSAAGGHAHTGSTSASGDHSHSIYGPYAPAGPLQHDATNDGDIGVNAAGYTTSSGGAGNHSHTFTTSSVGDHTHTLTTTTSTTHTHTVTVNAGGAHTPAGTNASTGGTETRPDNIALLFCIKT